MTKNVAQAPTIPVPPHKEVHTHTLSSDTSKFRITRLPHETATKVALAVSAIFLIAAFATIGYCAAVHNIHVWTGFGIGMVGLAGFIPSIYSLCQPHPDSRFQLNASEKVISNGVELACIKKTKQGVTTFQLKTEKFDYEGFKSWLFETAPKACRELFNKTLIPHIAKLDGSSLSCIYHRCDANCDLQVQKPHKKAAMRCDSKKYNFHDQGALYVDFAHAYTLGGNWREGGSGKEATLFKRSPKLALLAYLSHTSGISLLPQNGIPFFVPDVSIQQLDGSSAISPVTIAGVAALTWHGTGASYKEEDLNYLFQAFYRVCAAQKVLTPNKPIHTGPWGCDEFNNSEYTMVTLQICAAEMAGVELIFHEVSANTLNTAFNMYKRFKTPQALFNAILDKQTDSQWRTQKPEDQKVE